MTDLVRVELARYRSRRVIALLVLLAALLAALVAAKSAWDSRPITKQEAETAQVNADLAAQRSDVKADLDKCLADPERYLGTGSTAQTCRDNLTASPSSYLPRKPLDLTGTLKGNGLGVSLAVAGLLVIAASAFAGSDWASGSIVNQLLFVPGRGRLWAAKAVAVSVASAVVALVTIGGFWLAMYLVAVDRDVPHGSDVMSDVGWHLLRAVLFAVGASLGAFSLTMLFRHSVATLALLFAYSVGGEILAVLVPIDDVGRWTLGNNVFGWLETRMQFFDPSAGCARRGDCEGFQHIGHLQGGAYLLVLMVVAVLLSATFFARRDVDAT
ncbi:ABC-2 type transport system permease protein [Marmoricola sp. URHA0025 HA25]